MAQPTWTGLDPPVLEGRALNVGRGDWQQGPGAEALIRPKWLAYVQVDGHAIYGDVPRMPSAPANVTYQGELAWSDRLRLDLAAYADGRVHTALVYRYAASFFQGWGDHPEDAWEWGHYNARDLATPARSVFPFMLGTPSEPPPPPDGRDESRARQELDAAIQELAGSLPIRLRWGRPTRALEHAREAHHALGWS